ncbi:MAG: sigma D regulator [Gammaproteobacteria bacterium]|nr:sigma D regulator [Gammaproteobacteria bacterium]
MSVETSVQERRGSSHNNIQTLVSSRTGTLSLYSQLASKTPFSANKTTQKLLQEFCESLVDYAASAHFQLYRHIDEKKERRQPVQDIAQSIYPQIASITQKILDFNDKYDCKDECIDFQSLDIDLSELGELLADRIDMEDRVINALTATASRD